MSEKVSAISELIERVNNYAWREMTLLEQQELREQAAQELARLRAIEAAARVAIEGLDSAETWGDVGNVKVNLSFSLFQNGGTQ